MASNVYSKISFSIWNDLETARHVSGGGLPQLPELRSAHLDWVRDGLKLPGCAGNGCLVLVTRKECTSFCSLHLQADYVLGCSEIVHAARAQWQHFMTEAPDYPRNFFKGRGIAILGGGPQYMVPAWVNVHMLRATGKYACTVTQGARMPFRACAIKLACHEATYVM